MKDTRNIENNADDLLIPETPIGNDSHVQVYFIDLSKAYLKYIRWQWHAEFEVIIVNHGEADVMVDDKMVHLTPGQGVFINQNVLHAIHPYGESRNCSLYSLTFHPDFLFNQNNHIAEKYFSPVINSPELKTFFMDEAEVLSEKLLDLINDVIAANAVKAYGYELVTRSKLYEFWYYFLQSVDAKPSDEPKPLPVLSLDEIRVKEAIRYVEDNYAQPITLDTLAASIHISKSECCRCFKRTLKLTPIEYVMRFRIFAAARLLHNGDPTILSISDLAFSVGFNSVSYFNKTFRKYLNQTPSEYKRALKRDSIPTMESFILVR
ncbi:MAG: AraC family transcriptional regulator [Lachnospiraceae bacterium]|nr:AraC family transcriptional regulator [Lachnospiraceae bacterium]